MLASHTFEKRNLSNGIQKLFKKSGLVADPEIGMSILPDSDSFIKEDF